MQSGLNLAMHTLADRVKERRATLGLTQGQVAKKSGLKQPDISKIELGLIQETTKILGLAKALECDPNWLLSGAIVLDEAHTSYSANQQSSSVDLVMKAMTPGSVVGFTAVPDPLAEQLMVLFKQLDNEGKSELLAYVRGFVSGRRPHPYGKASALAG
jgi:HTH-type transcriptional regulator, cell division transcriptional repressor